MIATVEDLLHQYDSLPVLQKERFARALLPMLPATDSEELLEEELCCAGDDLASMLSDEEADTS
jgi:hypothetical protein